MLKIIDNHQTLPFALIKVPAGFPSPADDHLENEIDIVSLLVKRPASTFLLQVEGDSMEGAGIFENDYVVVDKSIEVISGHIVVAVLNGDMTLKYFRETEEGRFLCSSNPQKYKSIELNEDNPPEFWGVVSGVVRRCV